MSLGAKVNVKDVSKETPLHLAASYDNLDGARMLIESGADLNLKNRR